MCMNVMEEVALHVMRAYYVLTFTCELEVLSQSLLRKRLMTATDVRLAGLLWLCIFFLLVQGVLWVCFTRQCMTDRLSFFVLLWTCIQSSKKYKFSLSLIST